MPSAIIFFFIHNVSWLLSHLDISVTSVLHVNLSFKFHVNLYLICFVKHWVWQRVICLTMGLELSSGPLWDLGLVWRFISNSAKYNTNILMVRDLRELNPFSVMYGRGLMQATGFERGMQVPSYDVGRDHIL